MWNYLKEGSVFVCSHWLSFPFFQIESFIYMRLIKTEISGFLKNNLHTFEAFTVHQTLISQALWMLLYCITVGLSYKVLSLRNICGGSIWVEPAYNVGLFRQKIRYDKQNENFKWNPKQDIICLLCNNCCNNIELILISNDTMSEKDKGNFWSIFLRIGIPKRRFVGGTLNFSLHLCLFLRNAVRLGRADKDDTKLVPYSSHPTLHTQKEICLPWKCGNSRYWSVTHRTERSTWIPASKLRRFMSIK